MKVTQAGFLRAFIKMADDGAKMGWHERNGGNLSLRLLPEEADEVGSEFREGSFVELDDPVPGLGGEFFLVSGSGKYFSNIASDPSGNLCIVRLDEKGEGYRILWGLDRGGRPTSEFLSHLKNHAAIRQRDENLRIVYHCHPANLIALSFILPPDEVIFTRELFEMMPECAMVFPEGVGVVSWEVPGSTILADKTSKIMREKNAAIWMCHGAFACGRDFDETFGLMHTMEKAGEILVKVRSMSDRKENPVTADMLRALSKAYDLGIDEKYLYERKSGRIGER